MGFVNPMSNEYGQTRLPYLNMEATAWCHVDIDPESEASQWFLFSSKRASFLLLLLPAASSTKRSHPFFFVS